VTDSKTKDIFLYISIYSYTYILSFYILDLIVSIRITVHQEKLI